MSERKSQTTMWRIKTPLGYYRENPGAAHYYTPNEAEATQLPYGAAEHLTAWCLPLICGAPIYKEQV